MFKTLSESDYTVKGKKTYPQSRALYDSQFQIGVPNIKNNYESVTNHFHKPQPVVAQKAKGIDINASHWGLSQNDNIDKNDHFKTETKNQFSKPRNPEKVGPVRDKTTLLKTNYTLGEERIEYRTTSKTEFTDKSQIKAPELQYKEKPKWDIINNTDVSKEKVQNANNFEGYNPHKSKNRTSNNQTDYPLGGYKLDPITRRILPTSYMIYEQNFKFK
jgi:hypothetical protein